MSNRDVKPYECLNRSEMQPQPSRSSRWLPNLTAKLTSSSHRLKLVDIDNGSRERLRRFLRKIVTDTAACHPVLILAREFVRIGAAVDVLSPVCIALQRDGGYGNEGVHRARRCSRSSYFDSPSANPWRQR